MKFSGLKDGDHFAVYDKDRDIWCAGKCDGDHILWSSAPKRYGNDVFILPYASSTRHNEHCVSYSAESEKQI